MGIWRRRHGRNKRFTCFVIEILFSVPFVFEIQFHQTAVFRLNRKRAVFNYLPSVLVISTLIYLTYSWLCVFLFWKMQFGDEGFCQWHNLSVTDNFSLLSSWDKEGGEKEWREIRRRHRHTDREKEKAEVSSGITPPLAFNITVEL